MGALYPPRRRADRGDPAALALHSARTSFNRPSLVPGWRYLLMLRRSPAGVALKPVAFHDLGQAARHLHRARAGGALHLVESPVLMAGHDNATTGVSIWTGDDATGDRRRFVGWLYLNGAGLETLRAALQRAEPGPVN